VLTLSAAVLELCRTGFAGTLHLGSTDSVDRFTLTRRAAVLMGFDASLVTAQQPGMVQQPEPVGSPAGAAQHARAARHRRGVLSVEKARRLLSTPMRDWETSVRRAVEGRPGNGR
jgi:dTDP-4-dehydrorhamnose reductase